MTLELDRPSTAMFPPLAAAGFDDVPASVGSELAIAEASRYADAGDHAAAEAAYLRADALLGGERSPRHAEVLVCLALLLRKRGALDQSASYFDLALAIFPEHRAALSQRLDIAREQGDLATASALRTRMLRFCESAEARSHVLSEIVDDALLAAASALRQALAIRPHDTELHERLCSLLEATFDYAGAVDATVALAESLAEPRSRARLLARAAELCSSKIGDVDRAVALFEAAIADDPTVAGAFEAIERVLVAAGDVAGTERAYNRQIERLRDGGHVREEAVLLRKLARLREEQLADAVGAISALQRATTLNPTDVPSQLVLARALDRKGASQSALQVLEGSARIAANDSAVFHEIHRIASGAGDFERAYFAASALIHLGEATATEQASYRRLATYGAPAANSALDETNLARLRPSVHPVRALLLTVHDAAVAAKLATLPARSQPILDERERLEPAKTTVTVAKVLGWIGKWLNLPAYHLFARPNQAVALAHPMTPSPTLILGAGVLSGRSVPELLFRTGYELGAQRELGRLAVFYPTTEELERLVAAAVGLCDPARLPSAAVELAQALTKQLDDQARSRLQVLVDAATAQQIAFDVRTMLRDLEILAGRIGLLACTDLAVATRQVALESRATDGLTSAERVHDLLSFAVSEVHRDVRAALGMTVGAPDPFGA